MKLPVPKEDGDGKRTMMTSGASPGRKGLLVCERRETSLVGGGRDVQDVQFGANMDFGGGDAPDRYASSTDVRNDDDSFNWDRRFDSHDLPPATTKTHTSGDASTPTSLPEEPISHSSENFNENASRERPTTDKSDADNPIEAKLGRSDDARNSTLAVVEDGKEPNFTANESNPTVPAPAEPSKTSTLRLSDRTRSESEDDIEKMDEPEQEGTLIGRKTLYKTQATTGDDSPGSDKTDKNGNRSDSDGNEADNDCVVQCLYYTIECCECVIF